MKIYVLIFSFVFCAICSVVTRENLWADWGIQTVDSIGLVGSYNSIAVDTSGYVHVCYYDETNGDLKYAKWKASSWYIVTVDSVGDVGRNTSIALDINNYPHISYLDSTNSALKYAKFDGYSWFVVTIDSPVAGETAIAIDKNGHPNIAYYNSFDKDLKYAKHDGSSWHVVAVDSTNDVGSYNSIALDASDHPHIAYVDLSNYDLKYAKWNGSSWEVQIVDPGEGAYPYNIIHGHPSIVLDDKNYPHISYNSINHIKYAEWSGVAWSTETVFWGRGWGGDTSLFLGSDGRPHISFTGSYSFSIRQGVIQGNGCVQYAVRNGVSWSVETIDSIAIEGEGYLQPRMYIDTQGYTHVSYYDGINCDLKYARMSTPPIISWTQEIGYTSDGVEPSTGDTSVNFVFNIEDLDSDGDAPMVGYPKIWFKKGKGRVDNIVMNYVSGDYKTGAIYSTSTALNSQTTYYFEAYDFTNLMATGVPTVPLAGSKVTASISGHIKQEDGTGISSTTVMVWGVSSATCITNLSGYYKFSDVLAGFNYTVSPTKLSWIFTPAVKTFLPLSSNCVNEDFIGIPSEPTSVATWCPQTVGENGEYVSISVDSNNQPHIAYYDSANGDLRYAKWTGSSWYIVTVDSTGDVGKYASMVLDSSDCPHIAYWDTTKADLKYARWTGSSWDIQKIQDYGGSRCSIAIDSNNEAHIVYLIRKYQLKQYGGYDVIHSVNYYNTRREGDTIEDFLGSVDGDVSIEVDSDDIPHISYYDGYGRIKYATKTGGSWSIQTIAESGGFYNSMAVDITDRIHMTYSASDGLKYARKDGSSWVVQTIDSNGGGPNSIDIDTLGYPHVSYYSGGKLRYGACRGSSLWSIEIVDSVGDYNSITLDTEGNPHLCYSGSAVKYARRTNNPFLSWTGESGYTSDGVEPHMGVNSTVFTFRTKYTGVAGDTPKSDYPKLHIKKGAVEISGSPFTMNVVSGTYKTGATYSFSTTLSPSNDYTYYFESYDIWNASATGLPTNTQPGPIVFGSSLPESEVYVYPNPTKIGQLTFKFWCDCANPEFEIRVFNIAGELVATIRDEKINKLQKPIYTYEWNCDSDSGEKLASGVYIYFLEAKDKLSGENAKVIKKLAIIH